MYTLTTSVPSSHYTAVQHGVVQYQSVCCHLLRLLIWDGKSKERIVSWASPDLLLYQVVLLVDGVSNCSYGVLACHVNKSKLVFVFVPSSNCERHHHITFMNQIVPLLSSILLISSSVMATSNSSLPPVKGVGVMSGIAG